MRFLRSMILANFSTSRISVCGSTMCTSGSLSTGNGADSSWAAAERARPAAARTINNIRKNFGLDWANMRIPAPRVAAGSLSREPRGTTGSRRSPALSSSPPCDSSLAHAFDPWACWKAFWKNSFHPAAGFASPFFAELVSLKDLQRPGRLLFFLDGFRLGFGLLDLGNLGLLLIERIARFVAVSVLLGLPASYLQMLERGLVHFRRAAFRIVAPIPHGQGDLSLGFGQHQQDVLIGSHQNGNVLGRNLLILAVRNGAQSNIVRGEDLDVLQDGLGLLNFSGLTVHLPGDVS